MTEARHSPVLIELPDTEAADPGAEPAILEPAPQGQAMQQVAMIATRRGSVLGRLSLWVFGALASLVISVAVWDFVTALLTRNSLLGWIALVLVGAALVLLLILALREAAAFARMARIDRLRAMVGPARHDLARAKAVLATLRGLYRNRPETAWALSRLAEAEPDVFDADALMSLTERELMAPLDALALTEVEAAARQVATVTALVPMALADVATALFANLRMIRRISQIYGGRSSTLGNLSLMRRVFAALLGAGAIALVDDLVGSVASGGILAKLSRRFGEGVVNGALTARVGLAALEACRPMPFHALEKPGTTATTSRALAGLLARAKA
jgi:putative membrane protein